MKIYTLDQVKDELLGKDGEIRRRFEAELTEEINRLSFTKEEMKETSARISQSIKVLNAELSDLNREHSRLYRIVYGHDRKKVIRRRKKNKITHQTLSR